MLAVKKLLTRCQGYLFLNNSMISDNPRDKIFKTLKHIHKQCVVCETLYTEYGCFKQMFATMSLDYVDIRFLPFLFCGMVAPFFSINLWFGLMFFHFLLKHRIELNAEC